MAAAGFEVVDVESLRRHYARTCHEWADRLEANRSRAIAIVGDKRFRIWNIYLAGCAYGFAEGWINIYQALARKATRSAVNPLPLTRDYMYHSSRTACWRRYSLRLVSRYAVRLTSCNWRE
jgi:cyclopropane-fatty-acyl-phospholipid synthase